MAEKEVALRGRPFAQVALRNPGLSGTTGGQENHSGAKRNENAFHEMPRLEETDRGLFDAMEHIKCLTTEKRRISDKTVARFAMIRAPSPQ